MTDASTHWMRASAALGARRFADAYDHLRALVDLVDRIDFEYDAWVRALLDTCRHLGREREAAACAAYLGSTEGGTPESLQEAVAAARAGDAAALRGLRAYAVYVATAGHHRAAAVWFGEVGMSIHRAVALERARDDAVAAEAWEPIALDRRLASRPYERALVHLNRALCLRRIGDPRAPQAVADATSGIEEVADEFERAGLRERAFDCYQLLARVGQETGTFTNVAEGYLNSIRILRADGLKIDALRLYEAFVAVAERFGEHHAAASALREAADMCAATDLPYASDLRLRAGDRWIACARAYGAAGRPVRMVENAYLAAAECYASVHAFGKARKAYQALAGLDLPAQARRRYQRLFDRLSEVAGDAPRVEPVPEFVKQSPEYDEVWYVDLEEFEAGGDPVVVAAGIVGDRRYADIIRRHALLLILEVEAGAEAVEVVRRLSAIRAYPVLACLEAAFETPDPSVREAVAAALGALRFKRTFVLVERALADPDPAVRGAAAASVGRLVFPHAIERLARLFFRHRGEDDADGVALQALRAIGRSQSVDGLEFLCDRLRDQDPLYLPAARELIEGLTDANLLPFLRREAGLVPPEERPVIERAIANLAGRGDRGASRGSRRTVPSGAP